MAHPIVNPNARPYSDYVLNADRIREFRMQVAETAPNTPEEIIVGMTVRIGRWVPIAIAEPLVRAWFAADTSPRMLPHLAALRYANGSNRLDAALCIALLGNVTQTPPNDWLVPRDLPQGTWIVRSQTRYESYYILNGTSCDCKDAKAPTICGKRACKHQLAVWLMQKAGLTHVELYVPTTPGADISYALKLAAERREYLDAHAKRPVAA